MKIITSLQNPLIKELRKQQSTHIRKKSAPLVFVEGKRACEPFLSSPHFTVHTILCTQDLISWVDEHNIPDDLIVQTSPEIINTLSQATTPSGIIGAFSPITEEPTTRLSTALVLAEIQDPGNMGTLIRTATALGAECIIINGVSPYHPKVVQSSAGTIAHARIRQMPWDKLHQRAKEESADLIALVPDNGTPLSQLKKNHAKAQLLVVGNEAHGIKDAWLKECSYQATIPTTQSTESLNAAIAGAIALYHITTTQP